jgi:hypothetical protein
VVTNMYRLLVQPMVALIALLLLPQVRQQVHHICSYNRCCSELQPPHNHNDVRNQHYWQCTSFS